MSEETLIAPVGELMKLTVEQSTAIGAERSISQKPSILKDKSGLWIQSVLL